MASNGLIANPSKTVFMILNNRSSQEEIGLEIKVGREIIKESDHTKLLGVGIQYTQKWDIHVKNLTNSLNDRLFQIRRIKSQIPKEHLMKVVHSIFNSIQFKSVSFQKFLRRYNFYNEYRKHQIININTWLSIYFLFAQFSTVECVSTI